MAEAPEDRSDAAGSVARGSEAVAVLCPECGELIEVKDPAAVVRALHLMNACELRALLTGRE